MKYRRPQLGFTFFILVAIAAVLIGQHYLSVSAQQNNAPTDMPKNARFVPATLDPVKNQGKGEWVACHYDLNQKADLCRLTNQRGVVVFEGQFLPVGKTAPLPDEQLQIASYEPTLHWVPGPIEGFPIPVLPLQNGAVLVPSADSRRLAARWKTNPTELAAMKR